MSFDVSFDRIGALGFRAHVTLDDSIRSGGGGEDCQDRCELALQRPVVAILRSAKSRSAGLAAAERSQLSEFVLLEQPGADEEPVALRGLE